MAAGKRSVSKIDVAELAGVSHQSVTRVLHHHPYVSEETRQKVLDACEKLNYRVNLLASYMRTKKTYALGMVIPSLNHAFFARMVNSVDVAAETLGYHIILARVSDRMAAAEQSERLSFLLQRQVEALIFTSPLKKGAYDDVLGAGVPVVTTAHPFEGMPMIGVDNAQGARIATEHLLELGHRDIAHVGGMPRSNAGMRRLDGYKEALAGNGIDFRPELVAACESWNMENGYAAAMELMGRNIHFTAIFAANDYLAIGVMKALWEKGMKVPDDVSVVGFVGDPIGQYSTPGLTTVFEPVEDIGRTAVKMLVKHITSPSGEIESILLPGRLVVRESTRRIKEPR